jgi:uncharacterized protein
MELEVTDNPEQDQYEIRADGELAGFVQYHLRNGVIALVHTETDDRFRGQGLAGRLVQSTLDAARERHLSVLPYCPYVRRWIADHPAYADLVPEARRNDFGL